MIKWYKCKERLPERNGYYLTQMDYGDVHPLEYTAEGGWNTFIDHNGVLHREHAINDGSVIGWYNHPEPKYEA